MQVFCLLLLSIIVVVSGGGVSCGGGVAGGGGVGGCGGGGCGGGGFCRHGKSDFCRSAILKPLLGMQVFSFFPHVFYTQVVGVGVDVNVALGLNVGGFEIVDVGGGGGDCD